MFGSTVLPTRGAYIAVLALCAVVLQGTSTRAQNPVSVRVGWQPTTTVEAQIAHVLQKTDILERNGLKGQFTMFSFGPAVNEALVSGALDIGFVGDMPSVSLAAVNADNRDRSSISLPRRDYC